MWQVFWWPTDEGMGGESDKWGIGIPFSLFLYGGGTIPPYFNTMNITEWMSTHLNVNTFLLLIRLNMWALCISVLFHICVPTMRF